MSKFLDKYVRGPINQLIEEAPRVPEMVARTEDDAITIGIGNETLRIDRAPLSDNEEGEGDMMPNDISDDIPG